MNRKGQGALEYLLLIGGAILVAVIVISILVGLTGSSGSETEITVIDGFCAKYQPGTADDDDCIGAPASLTSGSTTCANADVDGVGGILPDNGDKACITISGRCGVNRATGVTDICIVS